MSKFILPFFAVITLPMLSCSSVSDSAKPKPISLNSDESDLPWNRPFGPEGAGALGALGR